ncbi:hypothetical protein OAI11_00860 [Rhodospirillales bacterium]|nr:hypothetical protein [Rhodospirillales bacterium]
MFFNKHRKAADQISVIIENIFRSGFAVRINITDEGKFNPPYGFWQDEYILAFAFSLGGFILEYDLGLKLKPEKKGEFQFLLFQNLCGADAELALRTVMTAAQSGGSPDFERGADDAGRYFFAAKGRLRENLDDPIIQKANEIASSMHDVVSDIGLPSSSTGSLAGAILVLTLNKHIREIYLGGGEAADLTRGEEPTDENDVEQDTSTLPRDLIARLSEIMVEVEDNVLGKDIAIATKNLKDHLGIEVDHTVLELSGRIWFDPKYPQIGFLLSLADSRERYKELDRGSVAYIAFEGQDELKGFYLSGEATKEPPCKWMYSLREDDFVMGDVVFMLNDEFGWEIEDLFKSGFLTRPKTQKRAKALQNAPSNLSDEPASNTIWFKTSDAAIEYVGKYCDTDFQVGQAYPAYVLSNTMILEEAGWGMYNLNVDGSDRVSIGEIKKPHKALEEGDFVLWGCDSVDPPGAPGGTIIAELELGIDTTTDQWIIKREI